ncbi:MAG: putative ABC transporter permease [Firmicutes bacterium]|nr:putative ABC transporter permease [Bacillota bacterium]
MDRKLSEGKYLLNKYPRVFFEFLIFAFVGLLIETGYVFFLTGKWTVRGALGFGLPIIHIYGFGALIVVYWLGRYSKFPIFFFVISSFLMSMVELAGSYMETVFGGPRSWDYSDKPFNFEGRICLSTALGWGTLAFLFFFLMYPEIGKFIKMIPRKVLVYGSLVLTIYTILVTINKYIIN